MIYRIPANNFLPKDLQERPLQKYYVILGFNSQVAIPVWSIYVMARDGYQAYELVLFYLKKKHEEDSKSWAKITEKDIVYKKILSIDDFYISLDKKEEIEKRGPVVID